MFRIEFSFAVETFAITEMSELSLMLKHKQTYNKLIVEYSLSSFGSNLDKALCFPSLTQTEFFVSVWGKSGLGEEMGESSHRQNSAE